MSESPEPDDIPYRRNDHMHELIRSVSRRPPSDAPYLAESTARYILQKSNENKTGNERDIEEALAALPLRITRLLYDLAILSQGGYLDDLDKNWNYLDIDENRDYLEEIPDHLIYVTRYSHARNTASNRDDFYFNLGFNVGLGLSAVTGTISEDIRASKFLAGFTTAYSTDHFQRSRRSSNNSEINSEIDPDRKQLLERYGVEPTKYIDEHINFLNFGWSNIEEREILSPKEATQEFLEERVGEWFGKCNHLWKKLESEWDSISEAGVPGMKAEPTLEALWELESADKETSLINSAEIAKQAGKRSSYQVQVSQVLNRLSLEGKEPSEETTRTFEAEEIVYYGSGEWKLTGYGKLLLYHVFVKGRDPVWIQNVATIGPLPPDEESYNKKDFRVLEKGVNHFYDN